MLKQCSKEPCEPISLSTERALSCEQEAKSLVSKSLLQKKFAKKFSKIIKILSILLRINDIIFVLLKK